MASEPIVGEGDGAREKQRFNTIERKVYTRKAFKGPKKNNTTLVNTNTNTVANAETNNKSTEANAETITTTTSVAAPSVTTASTSEDNFHKKDKNTTENDNNNIYKKDNDTTTDNDNNNKKKEKDDIIKEKDNNINNIKEKDNNIDNIKEKDNSIDEVDNNHNKKGDDNNNNNNNNVKEKENNINENDNQNINNSDGNLTQPPPSAQPVVTQNGNSTQQEQEQEQQVVSRIDSSASGNSSSLNRQEVAVLVVEPESRDAPAKNGVPEKEGPESRIKINLASRSKQEMRDLRRKLESELDVVRGLVKRIEVKQGLIGVFGHSHDSVNDGVNSTGGRLRRVHLEVASVGVPREATRPLHQLSISVLENSQSVSDNLEKEKRTPKANQFYHNSEFLLAKDKFPPAESNKKSKLNGKKHSGGDLGQGYGMGSKFFKSCSSLLEKLMKHKHGWVFNEPVDAAKLGLHDYHIIIKHPMDLGTIKSRLNKNWYKSPKEFAEDVRLTFHNAMTYNPKGQDVHVMAEQLCRIFEDRWAIIESDYSRELRFGYDYGTNLPTPTSRKAPPLPPPPLDMRRILDRSESISHHADPKLKPMTITPRTPAPKKPKAKDPHKRDMTYDEKQKLSTNLQSLPSEKLDAILQIIKRRNSELFQHDDEIEVDIDSVDIETLWELDRFVTNYKKNLSKHKRKAEMAMQARAEAAQNVQEQTLPPIVAEVPKEAKTDDKIVTSSTPIQGDNQGDNRSRSSSSSSSSSDSGSSSSDSDSDSSSASGSDAGSPRS